MCTALSNGVSRFAGTVSWFLKALNGALRVLHYDPDHNEAKSHTGSIGQDIRNQRILRVTDRVPGVMSVREMSQMRTFELVHIEIGNTVYFNATIVRHSTPIKKMLIPQSLMLFHLCVPIGWVL